MAPPTPHSTGDDNISSRPREGDNLGTVNDIVLNEEAGIDAVPTSKIPADARDSAYDAGSRGGDRVFTGRAEAGGRALEAIGIAVVYFLVAKGSLAFASINPSATPIWPPTGLALAVILLGGYRFLPAILVGAFVANATTAGGVAASAAIAAGNTLEAFIGAFLMRAWANGSGSFETPTGIAKFAAIMAGASTPISATIGVTTLGLVGAAEFEHFGSIWATWWLGDVAGAVMVCPPLVLWIRYLDHPKLRPTGAYETIALFGFTVVVAVVALGPLGPSAPGKNALAFLAVLPLLWAASRRGPRDISSVALILSGVAVWGVAAGAGPFVQSTLNASFLLLVSFIASVTLPSLALSAAVAAQQRALVQREEDYRLLVDSVRDYAIFMLDAAGHVITWNSGAARIYQYASDEILGKHFSRFFTDADRQAGEPASALAAASERGKHDIQGWRVRRDETRYWAETTISAIRDDDGVLIGFAKVTRDISEKRLAEEALEQTSHRLHQAQRLETLGQLTAAVAHDFNNLLSAISSGLKLLERPSDAGTVQTVVDEMRHAVARGAGLTRQLLNFARPEKPKPDVVDVRRLLKGMRGILERALGTSSKLKLQFENELWHVNVDPGQLEMVVLNLTINARDAMPDGGTVTIAAENILDDHLTSFVRISVSDTGIGMSPDIEARAFELFFTTKEAGRGTGLGLNQVRRFAEQSGGSTELHSVPGQGTVVAIRLPRA